MSSHDADHMSFLSIIYLNATKVILSLLLKNNSLCYSASHKNKNWIVASLEIWRLRVCWSMRNITQQINYFAWSVLKIKQHYNQNFKWHFCARTSQLNWVTVTM